MENSFDSVLEEGEKVIETRKADSKAWVTPAILPPIFIGLFASLGLLIAAFVTLVEWCPDNALGLWIALAVVVTLFVILVTLIAIFNKKASKNYEVCLTNKRLIIKHGVFTNDYDFYSIEQVTGNIQTFCNQSIFNKKDDVCNVCCDIELYPVGHNNLSIFIKCILDGNKFAKKVESVVKANAKSLEKSLKE
ncbi:MAG: hypothetical protein MJ149_00520 [Clostridia bacterium]|nr:hypothetical protein [Clostridia bacterium]